MRKTEAGGGQDSSGLRTTRAVPFRPGAGQPSH
nr:MAG TPA: hypothetical protein [Caudoviricetes sp.]DAH87957.1 MAG TPA: hypothetical protein [Caudoviricetes sp.]DAU15231.1 MAG TPA: hypothetical protein [Caudoviricetes sp.]